RYRLAAAGGPGNQDHALVQAQGAHVQLLLVRFVAQHIDAQLGAAGVEDTQNDLFAPQGGQGIHPEVDGLAARELELDAAVLRNAAFRNVHTGHDLDARGNAAGDVERRAGHFAQHAVLAVADAVELL